MAKPMLAIDVDITPPPAIIVGGFYRAANGFRNFKRPIETVIRDVVAPAINANFEAEGIPPWTPLSEGTYQSRIYPNMPILQQSQTLKDMATSLKPWTIDNNEAYLLASSLGPAYYGAIHEKGTKILPARPWSTIQTSDEEKIEQIFMAYSLGTIIKFATVTTIIGAGITAALGGLGSSIRILTGGL